MLKIPVFPVLAKGVCDATPAPELPGWHLYLNGRPCPIRYCRDSAVPFNRVWPGKQRSRSQTELAGFANFSADEPLTVELETEIPLEHTVIRPLSAGISPKITGENRISFEIVKPGQYVIEAGTMHKTVYLFWDPVGETPEKREIQRYFGPGIHVPGLIRLRSGDSVYIDPAAVVYGNLYGENVHDVRIFGGGVIHGGAEERVLASGKENYTKSAIKFYHSSGIRIDGVIIQDAACWTASFFDCSDIRINNVKIIGQWRYNTDGIDFVNTDNVGVTNSFVRSFDDGLVLKGADDHDFKTVSWTKGHSVRNIEVRHCIFWCGWGRTLEVGIETAAPEFSDILFEDCDLIHNSAVCMDLQNGNYADMHDIVFRDIRVEYQAETLPEIYQEREEMVYDPQGKMGVPILFLADNHRYQPDKVFGSVHDVLLEHIAVFAEPGVPEKLPFRIANLSPESRFANFTVRDLTINGRRVFGPDDVECLISGHVENVRWE